ncbi:hypothetical protein DPMN_009937 [Dreissena polymorpha]|uniref:Uncharacterized protein n=1 Tax=Dreissena polymorpha TaxID=45954 RepID=A0A9D4N181_DREPO|nr:hypothetical protein DPMN_009937 [Dreissena polymorpha]
MNIRLCHPRKGCSQELEACHLFQLLDVHGDICNCVVRSVHHDLRLLDANPHYVCSCSFIKSFGEVLEFTAVVAYDVNVISESQVRDESVTDGYGVVMVFGDYLPKEKVIQDVGGQKSLTDAH